jgi:hypothetical protein
MLAPRQKLEAADWTVRDIYARSDVKTCWVLWVDGARFVPGDCSDCGGDTLVDLNTRREDDGDCARCGARGASIYYEGCRDSFTLMHFVAIAIFGEEPEVPETIDCARCNRALGLEYYPLDSGVCTWCTSEQELNHLRAFVALMESGHARGGSIAMFDQAERRIEELQAELETVPE